MVRRFRSANELHRGWRLVPAASFHLSFENLVFLIMEIMGLHVPCLDDGVGVRHCPVSCLIALSFRAIHAHDDLALADVFLVRPLSGRWRGRRARRRASQGARVETRQPPFRELPAAVGVEPDARRLAGRMTSSRYAELAKCSADTALRNIQDTGRRSHPERGRRAQRELPHGKPGRTRCRPGDRRLKGTPQDRSYPNSSDGYHITATTRSNIT